MPDVPDQVKTDSLAGTKPEVRHASETAVATTQTGEFTFTHKHSGRIEYVAVDPQQAARGAVLQDQEQLRGLMATLRTLEQVRGKTKPEDLNTPVEQALLTIGAMGLGKDLSPRLAPMLETAGTDHFAEENKDAAREALPELIQWLRDKLPKLLADTSVAEAKRVEGAYPGAGRAKLTADRAEWLAQATAAEQDGDHARAAALYEQLAAAGRAETKRFGSSQTAGEDWSFRAADERAKAASAPIASNTAVLGATASGPSGREDGLPKRTATAGESPEAWASRAGQAQGEQLRDTIERIAAGVVGRILSDAI
jgi:hypothetical protein